MSKLSKISKDTRLVKFIKCSNMWFHQRQSLKLYNAIESVTFRTTQLKYQYVFVKEYHHFFIAAPAPGCILTGLSMW